MSEINETPPVLPGQMTYEEVPRIESVKEKPKTKINGQMSFDDVAYEKPKKMKKEKVVSKDEEIVEDAVGKENTKDANLDSIETSSYSNGGNNIGLIEKSICEVLHDSMIPYTEHVVLDRALPRVEDGLKPVQRRILYSMLELGVTPDKPFRKSARIVGDCMGKYHPHGDSSVYNAMVRMSQDFCMSAPLVQGHGNFGSVDGDSAAAMRYTEARLQPLAMELLRDLEKNTVRWCLNFDDTLKEPDMLPGRFPNLLVNGASGIAVGLATNIPPHNLAEVIDGTVAYIDNPKITLDEMMKYIPAPDFPTGGLITAGEEVKKAYQTGKGRLIMRARVHLESKGDKKDLVITEIPYMVNKANMLQKIVNLKTDGKNCLSDISEIRDESDRSGMRAVIRLKKEANVKQILAFLFKNTELECSFAINTVAIADGKPKLLGLLEIISYYVEYQRDIILRRSKFDLDAAKDRAHILEGLLIAIANIDEVIRIIKKSSTTSEAKLKLRERFLLSEKQAQAILDMRLARLVNLESLKLEQELAELNKLIKKLSEIVASKKLQLNIVKTEMLEIKNAFGQPRRSEIIDSLEIGKLAESDCCAVSQKPVMIGVTSAGTIKSIAPKNYSMALKDITDNSSLTDIHKILFEAKQNSKAIFFTDKGNAFKLQVSQIPEAKWRDKGALLKQIEPKAQKDEQVVSAIILPDKIENQKLLFITQKGFVKKTMLSEYDINKSYYQAIKLKENDKVVYVSIEQDSGSVIMVADTGLTLNMSKTDIPIQGRISSGVIGISLEDNENVVFGSEVMPNSEIVILTNKGFVKKLALTDFEVMPRNRKGLRAISFTDNGSKLVFAMLSSQKSMMAVFANDKYSAIDTFVLLPQQRYNKGEQKVIGTIENAYLYLK